MLGVDGTCRTDSPSWTDRMTLVEPIALERPVGKIHGLEEPHLRFGGGHLDIDPKIGLTMWGPHSFGTARHPTTIRLAVIGPARAGPRRTPSR
jgi:hypothetical protein